MICAWILHLGGQKFTHYCLLPYISSIDFFVSLVVLRVPNVNGVWKETFGRFSFFSGPAEELMCICNIYTTQIEPSRIELNSNVS